MACIRFRNLKGSVMDTPIACTLTSDDLAAQRERWHRLTLDEREETADGLRLVFRDLPGTRDELRALVAIETVCCAWATWELDGVVLHIRSKGEGIAAVHALSYRNQPA
jgi:hypothetical protein